jgi:arabinogalactan endo-1,4-beta-galactosidase
MVQIGNEVINGMLWPDGRIPDNWDNFADLVKAGVAGVYAGAGDAPRPRIMMHIDRGGDKSTDEVLLRQTQFLSGRVTTLSASLTIPGGKAA